MTLYDAFGRGRRVWLAFVVVALLMTSIWAVRILCHRSATTPAPVKVVQNRRPGHIYDVRGALLTPQTQRAEVKHLLTTLLAQPAAQTPPTLLRAKTHLSQGDHIYTTLDARLMSTISEVMRDQRAGAVVAIDPRDGSVRALYSKSAPDAPKQALYKTMRAFTPGGVYNIVSAAAAINEGQLTEGVHCNGHHTFEQRTFRCWKRAGHQHINASSSLAQSCNMYHFHVANQLSRQTLIDYANKFGFGQPTGIALANESAGRIPDESWYQAQHNQSYTTGFALSNAIGQGDVTATPIQVAMAYAMIANGGTLYAPRLLNAAGPDVQQAQYTFPTQVRKQHQLTKTTLNAIQKGLWDSVNTPEGTAYAHRVPHLDIAGKTGTAQVLLKARAGSLPGAQRRDHAWFASYAPSTQPKLVLVVLIEHGGTGGAVAAPVAMEIYRRYFGDAKTP